MRRAALRRASLAEVARGQSRVSARRSLRTAAGAPREKSPLRSCRACASARSIRVRAPPSPAKKGGGSGGGRRRGGREMGSARAPRVNARRARVARSCRACASRARGAEKCARTHKDDDADESGARRGHEGVGAVEERRDEERVVDPRGGFRRDPVESRCRPARVHGQDERARVARDGCALKQREVAGAARGARRCVLRARCTRKLRRRVLERLPKDGLRGRRRRRRRSVCV
jgi:hypothetical protein